LFCFLGFWSFNIWSCNAECTRKGKNHSFAKVRPEEEKFHPTQCRIRMSGCSAAPFSSIFLKNVCGNDSDQTLSQFLSNFRFLWLHYLCPILIKLQHRQGKYRNGKKDTCSMLDKNVWSLCQSFTAFWELLITESYLYISFLRFLSVADLSQCWWQPWPRYALNQNIN